MSNLEMEQDWGGGSFFDRLSLKCLFSMQLEVSEQQLTNLEFGSSSVPGMYIRDSSG